LDTREGAATRGHSLKILKTRCRTSLSANSFGKRIVNNWYVASSVNYFKNRLEKFCETLGIMYCEDPVTDNKRGVF
jgi:hypothetical protein